MAIWHEEKANCFIIHVNVDEPAESDLDRIRQVLTVAFLHNHYHIVLDISQCKMIDSYFIGLLISTFREIREFGGKICLAGPSEHVIHALQIIRLDKVMAICPTIDEAIQCLTAKESV